MNNSVDVVCAFEVLEHISLDKLPLLFSEMRRVSKSYVIVSVPNISLMKPRLRVGINIILGKIKINNELSIYSNYNKISNKKEHYWEIGVDGITVSDIENIARSNNLILTNKFFTEPWFQFFIFQKSKL